ncbi:MAG: RNA polymerase sigma factor SigM [Actinomycetota bacterium]|nr:RNA polymerase sigma factor SigM [Actinomycetota bacterium]
MIRSEDELLAAHVAGDRFAFAELVDRLTGTLWSVARGALNSPEDADEAVQDALIRAHQGAGRFRGDSSVATWVVRILVNVCLDRRRYNRSRAAIPLSGAVLELVGGSLDPISALETRLEVWTALDELPAQQRLPIVLVDVHDYPVAEVARMLGIPAGTVKSRCARGRARLLTLLRDVEEVA